MGDTIQKRRWFQFSLRTFFLFVTALCLVIGWFAYQRNWIRQRHAFMEQLHSHDSKDDDPFSSQPYDHRLFWSQSYWQGVLLKAVNHRKTPWSLRMLGEPRQSDIVLIYGPNEDEGERLIEIWKEIDHAHRLFPEADIYPMCWEISASNDHHPRARTVSPRPTP